MQVAQAGTHKLIVLELEPEVLVSIAKQAGFDATLEDGKRTVWLDLTATGREGPLLLFDAADPGNLGWFSRCQFYVDGQTGHVLQTPITVANRTDRIGRTVPEGIRVQFTEGTARQLPAAGQEPRHRADGVRSVPEFSQRAAAYGRGRLRRIHRDPAGRPHRSAGPAQLTL